MIRSRLLQQRRLLKRWAVEESIRLPERGGESCEHPPSVVDMAKNDEVCFEVSIYFGDQF